MKAKNIIRKLKYQPNYLITHIEIFELLEYFTNKYPSFTNKYKIKIFWTEIEYDCKSTFWWVPMLSLAEGYNAFHYSNILNSIENRFDKLGIKLMFGPPYYD